MRDVFTEIDQDSLTAEDKKFALNVLMFMTQKRDGKIKSRGCVDGRPQRLWTNKEDVSSPTPHIESVKYTCGIDAAEGRHVVIADLKGFFLQTETDKPIILKISGKLALALVEFDPKTGRNIYGIRMANQLSM